MPVLLICPVCEKKFSVSDESKASGRKCLQCRTELYCDVPIDVVKDSSSFEYAGILSEPKISLNAQSLPKQIGRFQIRSLLGAGAFGKVYLATDTKLLREVALKVPHASLIDGAKARARFFREAVAGARLHHPNIVQVFDMGQDGEHFWIAAAYVKGKTLKEVLESEPKGFEWPANVIKKLAEALAVAHKARIVHRDVKPGNILIDKRAEPYLMDFGLASLKDAAASLTHVGAVIGTPAYMSPEQAAGMRVDNVYASDQYSLGVVFYEMLCHELPFHGPADFVITCHKSQLPQLPRERKAEIPLELESICMKMLAKLPSERYADCKAVAVDLQRWLEGKTVKAIPIASVLPEVLPAPEIIFELPAPEIIFKTPEFEVPAFEKPREPSATKSAERSAEKAAQKSAERRQPPVPVQAIPWRALRVGCLLGILVLLGSGLGAAVIWDLFDFRTNLQACWNSLATKQEAQAKEKEEPPKLPWENEGCSITFPEPPVEVHKKDLNLRMFEHANKKGKDRLSLGIVQLPKDIADKDDASLFDSCREYVPKGASGREDEKDRVFGNGHRGREIKVEMPSGEMSWLRLFRKHSTLFMIEASGSREFVESGEAMNFHESFRIKD